MGIYAEPLDRLIGALSKLPGIGPKSAQRIAFHILKVDEHVAEALVRSIVEMKKSLRFCSICFNITDKDVCDICSDPKRDDSLICVVEQFSDVISVEKSHSFRGVYHVLGGSLSPIDGITPQNIHMQELFSRINNGDVRELIVATNPTLEGEATAIFISDRIKPLGVRVTRIASGLPVGSDLEYADELTLSRAIEGRREM